MQQNVDALERFSRLVREIVGPVIEPAGFVWNESAFRQDRRAGDITILFEADHSELAERFPHLSLSSSTEIGCFDLWIRYSRGSGRIDAELEGSDVAWWLRDVGLPDAAARLEHALDARADVEAVVSALAEGLRKLLFDRGSAGR